MDDETIDSLTPRLIQPRPNTYTFTKAMAEYMVVENMGDMPTAIVRPSIVGASWQEPVPVNIHEFILICALIFNVCTHIHLR